MTAVLLVCTANICRSPMAEAILKKLVSARPDADQWRVESAGTWAMDGNPPALLSQFVMDKMGLDISSHQSQPTSLMLLHNFDLVLTMEDEHKKYLKDQYGEFADRIYMLSEMVGEWVDVPDPIGGELIDYEETAYLLERILTDGFDKIVQLARMHQQEL
jgi:protein-tyrosine-phosphatase